MSAGHGVRGSVDDRRRADYFLFTGFGFFLTTLVFEMKTVWPAFTRIVFLLTTSRTLTTPA